MWSRRGLLIGSGALALSATALAGCSEKVNTVIGFASRMMEITKRHGGKIGVSALFGPSTGDTKGSLSIESDQRFAMCSTFKWVLAANILQLVDTGTLKLSQMVKFTKADLLDYAPVVKANTKGEMTVAELCAAAVSLSDNTAANLLLPFVGGPAGLTGFVRGLGDSVTRFDRNEPSLNTNVTGDERDTTTPAAMSALLQRVFTKPVLKPESLKLLTDWMIATSTGKARIRASLPADWTAGDKTGTGENGACNDVAVIWPAPKDGPTLNKKAQEPIFLSIYTTGGALDSAGRSQVIADVAKLVFDTMAFAESLDDEEASAAESASS